MKKNILKKILSILFAISLCVQLTSFGFAHNIEHNITKMTPELQAIIASTTSDEKIPILIASWLMFVPMPDSTRKSSA